MPHNGRCVKVTCNFTHPSAQTGHRVFARFTDMALPTFAFVNGVAWNLVNLAVVCWLLWRVTRLGASQGLVTRARD